MTGRLPPSLSAGTLRVRWGTTKLAEFKPLAFQNWLRSLKAKPKTKGHLKAFTHRLFNKAKLYEMVDFHENPIALVEVRGISKRSRRPIDLTIDQFFLIWGLIPNIYQEMILVDQCTELRAGELLAMRWEKVDFERLCMKVEEGVVNGRIGPVKTEYSDDELPLDPNFALVFLEIKRKSNGSELLFPSPVTGRSYHASPIQQDYIRPAGWCLVACPRCSAAPGTAFSKWIRSVESAMLFRSITNVANLQPKMGSAASDGGPFGTPIGPCSAPKIPRWTFSKG